MSKTIRLWRIDDRGDASVMYGVDVQDADVASSGEVYFRPLRSLGATSEWSPGHYVFQIPGTRISGPSDWFGFEFKVVGT